MGMASQYSGFAGQQAEMSNAQQKQPVETFDEEAIARAFEEAEQSEMEAKQAREREQEADASKQNVEMGQDIVINECAERLMASEEGLVAQAPIIADVIHDPVMQDSKTYREQNSLMCWRGRRGSCWEACGMIRVPSSRTASSCSSCASCGTWR